MADTTTTTTTPSSDVSVGGLVGKVSGWIDNIFGFAGVYTAKYSKYVVYIIAILALSKIFKIKLNLDTSRKGK